VKGGTDGTIGKNSGTLCGSFRQRPDLVCHYHLSLYRHRAETKVRLPVRRLRKIRTALQQGHDWGTVDGVVSRRVKRLGKSLPYDELIELLALSERRYTICIVGH
jgi:hypothetical protein